MILLFLTYSKCFHYSLEKYHEFVDVLISWPLMLFKFHYFSCLCKSTEILVSLPQIPAQYNCKWLRICWQEPSVRHYVTCGQIFPFKNYKPFYIFQQGSYNNKAIKISWHSEILLYDRLTQISSFLNFPTYMDSGRKQVMTIYDQTQCQIFMFRRQNDSKVPLVDPN